MRPSRFPGGDHWLIHWRVGIEFEIQLDFRALDPRQPSIAARKWDGGMDERARANNFDLVRLFGAILVIYGHAYPLSGASVAPGFAVNAIGTVGVKIFFSISGYLVALSWLRDPNLGRFLLRRSLRIFPALIVVVLLSAFVLGPLVTRPSLADYFGNPLTYFYLKNIALYINYYLPGVFENNVYPGAVNGSLWSLPAEFSMYLLTPILIVGAGLLGGRIAFAIVGAIFIAVTFWLTSIGPQFRLVLYATDVWSWASVAPYFVVGMLYAVCRLDRFLNIYVGAAGLFSLAVFETSVPVKEAALLLVLPYFSLSFGSGYTPVLRKLMLGADLSYGLFLYGFPIEQTLKWALGPLIGPWKTFVLATIICAGLASLSWHFVEKRVLTWMPSTRKKKLAASIHPGNIDLPLGVPAAEEELLPHGG
jgi:peptidoglycan/LPS O-acetylase OafA/YrhL